MIHEPRGQHIHRSTRRQGKREETDPGTYDMVRLLKMIQMMIQQQHVRGMIRGGLAITAAAVVVVLPYYPPILVCNWHYMIRSPWMSRPPDHSFAFPFNIYKPLPNLLHLILATL